MFKHLNKWLNSLLDRQILKDGTRYDHSLIWMLALVTCFSLIMVYSSSIAYAGYDNNNQWFFLQRQMGFVTIGGICAFFVARFIPMKRLNEFAPYLLIFSYILLIVVLFAGREINGARRWIHVGPFNIQPTEFFKAALILYLASFLTRREDIVTQFKKVILIGIPIGVGAGLIYLEPDTGSLIVVLTVSISMLFLGGLPMSWFLTAAGIAIGLVGFIIAVSPYRMARVTGFLDPWADALGKGYQLSHALMASARGEFIGVGLGASLEKRFYLPEAHTDFIFAVISEEFGLLGGIILICVYLWIVLRALQIGQQAKKLELYFSAYAAQGIGLWIGIQSFFHMGVNWGILPTKGLTLPLISYGGSAVIIMLVCMAILVRIDYENRQKMQGFPIL